MRIRLMTALWQTCAEAAGACLDPGLLLRDVLAHALQLLRNAVALLRDDVRARQLLHQLRLQLRLGLPVPLLLSQTTRHQSPDATRCIAGWQGSDRSASQPYTNVAFYKHASAYHPLANPCSELRRDAMEAIEHSHSSPGAAPADSSIRGSSCEKGWMAR